MVKHFLLILSILSSLITLLSLVQMTEAEKLVCTQTQKNSPSAYNFVDLFEDSAPTQQPLEFAVQSVLSSGEIYKLEITQDNIYKLDFEFLSGFLDLSTIDISQIKLYSHSGGALEENISKSELDDLIQLHTIKSKKNGLIGSSDYILFYAQGADNLSFENNEIQSDLNVYSRSNFVFLKISPDEAVTMAITANIQDIDVMSHHTDAFSIIEEDNINLLGSYTSTQGSGQRWYDRIMTNQRSFRLDGELNIEHIDINEPITVDLAFAGRSEIFSKIQLDIDDSTFSEEVGRVQTGDVEATYARHVNIKEKLLLNNANPSITVNYPEVNETSEGWLDYFSIQYKRELVYQSTPLYFSNFESLESPTYGFEIDAVGENIIILDITDPLKPLIQEHSFADRVIRFGFDSSILRKFAVFDESKITQTPIFVDKVPNQNVHGLAEADFVIVYHPEFVEAAETLAAHRRNHNNLIVHTVSVDEIYNEFSSGKQDPSAIRNFSKMMYDRHDRFNFLLLLGDGSYDYLGISDGLENQSFVPAYETKESLNPLSAFPTDDFYALLSDNEGGNLRGAIDIAVGRIPVKTTTEADQIIQKIISYDIHPDRFGDWRLRVAFAADDEDSNIHLRQADGIAKTAGIAYPTFNQEKIYFDSYIQESTPGGARYPDANEKLNNEIFNGLLVTNYLGHGGPKGWSQERVLKIDDIKDWKNSTKLPLIITATCSFTGFDDPAIVTAGEEAILNPFGGAVALFSTVRSVYSSQNERLTKSVFDTIFTKDKGEYMAIGEILRRSKNANSADTINVNARKFLLIGDPSMKLALPQYDIRTTSINNQALDPLRIDTLGALQEVQIEGEIVDPAGNRVTGFNGIVYPTLFDKKSKVSTLANDGSSRVRDFEIQSTRIFKGAATVRNGEFSLTFTIPVDIDYSFGNGKLSYYATDGISVDASGYYDGFQIGGSPKEILLNDSPPVINAFLNSLDFKSGDKTNAEPLLLVTLSDDLGINFTGVSIGHDITAVIDGNTQNTIILNEFYTSDLDNPKQGTVRFPMKSLKPGIHSLTVKAFDVANNAADQTINFEVISPEDGEIREIYAFPNPMNDMTTFSFQHDFTNESIESVIQIFDLNGRLMSVIKEAGIAQSSQNQTISWDGKDSAGHDVPTGIYLYSIKINSTSLNISKESSFEKVVVIK